MDVLVNKRGHTYVRRPLDQPRADTYIDGIYRLMEENPLLRFSPHLDKRIRITSSGYLFDLNSMAKIEAGEHNFVHAEFIYGVGLVTLDDNGILVLHHYRAGVITQSEIIKEDVQIFDCHDDFLIYKSNGSILVTNMNSHYGGSYTDRTIILDIDDDDVFRIDKNLIFGERFLTLVDYGEDNSLNLIRQYKLEGNLIDAIVEPRTFYGEAPMIFIIEEIEGKYRVIIRETNHMDEEIQPYDIFKNRFLTEMGSLSEFRELVQWNEQVYLLNDSGVMVLCYYESNISSSDIPYEIMKYASYGKNPRSRIAY